MNKKDFKQTEKLFHDVSAMNQAFMDVLNNCDDKDWNVMEFRLMMANSNIFELNVIIFSPTRVDSNMKPKELNGKKCYIYLQPRYLWDLSKTRRFNGHIRQLINLFKNNREIGYHYIRNEGLLADFKSDLTRIIHYLENLEAAGVDSYNEKGSKSSDYWYVSKVK